VPDKTLRQQILVDNPRRLYDFPATVAGLLSR
jgi:predicted TIM-barrel fold metal-dependent hydrolase